MFYTNFTEMRGKIYLRHFEDDIDHSTVVTNFEPSLCVLSKEESRYKSPFGHNLEKMDFESIWAARNFYKEHSDVTNYPIFGNTKYGHQFINRQFKNQQWDFKKIRILQTDIETDVEEGFPDPRKADLPINMLTIKLLGEKKTVSFYFRDVDIADRISKDDDFERIYRKSENEKAMLLDLIKVFSKINPHIVTGWNIHGFDIPYLINRMKKLLSEEQIERLSPFGMILHKEVTNDFDELVDEYTIVGVSCIDYMKLYRKFILAPRPNYKLDTIAKIEIEDEKLKHHSGIPGHLLYKKYFFDALEYNIQDVILLDKLESKLNLLYLLCTVAYKAGVNYEEVFSPIRIWESLIHNDLEDHNIFYPCKRGKREKRPYEGGYCKDPLRGKYKWIASFDVDSEYPNIIRAMNMSPETLVEEIFVDDFTTKAYNEAEEICKGHAVNIFSDCSVEKALNKDRSCLDIAIEKNLTYCSNGVFFRKDFQGFMPRLVKEMFNDRRAKKALAKKLKQEGKEDESKIYTIEEQALKVLLNSLYGALANQHCMLFDLRLAEGITLTGQTLVRWVAADMNKAINKVLGNEEQIDYCVASDTDSIMFNINPLVQKIFKGKEVDIDVLAKFVDTKLQEVVNKSLVKFSDFFNCFEPEAFGMKREVIADSAIFIAKKRYIMSIVDNEGFRKRDIKIKGVEAIKSSTPKFCQDKMKDAFQILLHRDEHDFHKFVDETYEEFRKADLNDIAGVTGVNYVTKYKDGGGPSNSKAANMYNSKIKQHKLENLYPLIRDGDKIKYISIKTEKRKETALFGWLDKFPEETKMMDKIDYDTHFQKTFIQPMSLITKSMNWTVEETNSIDDIC